PGVFEHWPDAAQMQAARDWQRRKHDAGWAGVFWPTEYGGRGGTIMQQIIWNQEERRVVAPPAVLLMGQGHVGYTLLAHGTDEQKQRWLPPTLRGEYAWCQLFSEPGAGSDFAALACAATREGDHWRIRGEKIWISDGAYADIGFLVTRTDPDGPKHKGLTCFVVDMRAPGVTVHDVRHPNGGSHFSHVQFDELRVPDTDRVGAIDDGWRVALTTLMYERFFVGAWGSSGAFGGPQLRHLIELAGRCEVGGRPALQDEAVRQRLAAFTVRARAIEHMSYRVLTTVSQGGIPGPEGSIVKMEFARLSQEMANFGLELMGPAAMLAGADAPLGGVFQAALLENPCMRIAGGTDEIQHTIIAERLLGLPQESHVPRDLPFRDLPRGGGWRPMA
ncbi:MAG: acyl-CoA dehydrogenase family protein, partial [Gammaproteobacteria bacterium]